MKEATRIQIENMKNQTFGVEIEGNNITRKKAAEKAAAYFGTGRSEYTAGRNGYMTWSLGCPGQGVEVPAGCEHQRTGRPEMRNGHADPDLRGHGASAGAGEGPPESRDEE